MAEKENLREIKIPNMDGEDTQDISPGLFIRVRFHALLSCPFCPSL
jgi:hypothetical protein